MRSLLFVLIAIALVGGLWVAFKPAKAPSPAETAEPVEPATRRFDLKLVNRKLASGAAVIAVAQGDRVSLTVVSDKADELHLHGYDLTLKLAVGQPGELTFIADRSGRFDYELHHAHHDLGVLEVAPR